MIESNKIALAWEIAEQYHRNQEYGKSTDIENRVPYIYHIGQVYIEASLSIIYETDVNKELLLLSAIMHDLIEDTTVDINMLEMEFGVNLLRSIMALTKDESLAKSDQMNDSLQRILLCTKETAMVKICDRISNLSRRPPSHWTKEGIIEYAEEAEVINNTLGSSSKYLSNRLTEKIREYRIRFS
ncbi:guanosine-3',5'-bis(diphosphate) 3'-pyrophosphohydrolase [Lewinellaceae bacterium SD302]|nr:guanosine-3',5'-bis(diphosphate) 3'-pyrophosphohydrolase [Lewinellaceae bacterium SD302]